MWTLKLRLATSCLACLNVLVSWQENFGIQEISKRTWVHTRCYRLWSNAQKKDFKLPSRVKLWLLFGNIISTFKLKYKIYFVTKGDPIEFLSWLLNSLHLTLNGTKSATSSIIYKTFQGRMKIYTKKIPPVDVVSLILVLIFFL